ncbi:MAG: insulinase family protein, partial [Burkholderiales bacterium]
MSVLVRVDRRAPIVVHMVWYRAGAMDETSGRTGVAHVLEHMMFKGTETLAPGEFSRRVAALGGSENAFTSSDYTGYYQQVPSARLAEVMALEAERMSRLVLDPQEFEREVRVVMEERRTRTEDSPRGLLYEAFMASAFVATPYRHPVIGWASDLESLTVDDAREWYRRWYVPNNALLVVVGDVDPAEVITLAERTYGRIEARELPPRKPQREPPQRGLRRIEVKAPAEQPVLLMGWKVPSLPASDGDTDPYALEVLAAILDGGESARLPRELVRSQRIANSVGAGYSMAQRGPALFTLQAVPAQGRTAAELEQALRAEIARV